MMVQLVQARKSATCGVVLAIIFLSSIVTAIAMTLTEVIAPVHALGEKCQPIEGEHGWSPQASTMYSRNLADTSDGTSTQPIEKKYESFLCDKQKLTVYMYRYVNEVQAQSALRGAKLLVWGGKSPSLHHPERMFTIDNVLVVVSGSKPKFLAEVITGGSAAPGEKSP